MNISETTKDILPMPDTSQVCTRNPISDVTFYDPGNITARLDQAYLKGFPFSFIRDTRKTDAKHTEALASRLKEGMEIPARSFGEDWIVILILAAGFLYSLMRTFSKTVYKNVTNFFLFRGIGENITRDYGDIFHWQSTIINLISFVNLALFVYCAAFYYQAIPSGIPPLVAWLAVLAIVIVSITLRHIVCLVAADLSSQKDLFSEYLVTIYLSYRYMAIVLFVIVIFLAYSHIFKPHLMLVTGFVSAGILYLVRLLRLVLIFMKRSISILYLILYLCALEFLPVLVALKYFTGLF